VPGKVRNPLQGFGKTGITPVPYLQ